MSDAPGPDIAAQLAAVREEMEAAEITLDLISEQPVDIKAQRAHRNALRAALRTLEAAQAWAEDVGGHGLRQQLRQGAATSAIELLRAIRGEAP